MLGIYNLACLFLIKAYTKIINIVRLSDFSTRLHIQSEGSISQLWNTAGR